MMNHVLRPTRPDDAEAFNTMRLMKGVQEYMLAMPSERVAQTSAHLDGLGPDDHCFVAEVMEDGLKVVGFAGLHAYSGRKRHAAGIGMLVHPDYQGHGIGRALLEKLLDIADNWLMLKRVELEVYADNVKAVELYRSLGFEQEGLKRCGSIQNGRYADELYMARLR